MQLCSPSVVLTVGSIGSDVHEAGLPVHSTESAAKKASAPSRKALALRGGAAESTAAMPAATTPAAKAPTNETGPTTADALGLDLSSRGQPNKAGRATTANPLVASYLSSGGGEVAPAAAAAAMAKQYKGKNPQV